MKNMYEEFDNIIDEENTQNDHRESENTGSHDYDMQALMNLMGQNMEIAARTNATVGDLAKRQDVFDERIENIENRIETIQSTSEIDYSQQLNIRAAVHRRCFILLKIPSRKTERTASDYARYRKYFGLFTRRCYNECSRLGHLRVPYRMTKKAHYEDAIEDINAWVPSNGVSGLMMEKDEMDRLDRDAS